MPPSNYSNEESCHKPLGAFTNVKRDQRTMFYKFAKWMWTPL